STVREQAGLELPDEAIDLAVRRGRGSARDALSVLDQVAASETVDDDLPELEEVVEALAERDAGRALVAIAHLTSAGYGPQQLAGDLVDHLRQRFLTLVAPDLVSVSGAEREAGREQAERVGLATLVRAMEELGTAQVAMRDAPDPRVDLEVALVRLTHPEADDSPAALLARIERLEARAREGDAEGASPGPSSQLPEAAPRDRGPDRPAIGGIRRRAAAGSSGPSASTEQPDAASRPAGAGKAAESSGAETTAPPVASPPGGQASAAPGGQASAPPGGQAPTTARSEAPSPPPAAPPPAAAPATSPSSEPVPGLPSRDELVQAWGDHVISGLRPKAKALFQAGRFVGVDGEHALYGLPNETHRSRCEAMREEVERALADHFGRPVPLRLVVEPGADAAAGLASPTSAPGRSPSSTARRDEDPSSAEPAGGADDEDLDIFDESQLGEVADVGNLAEARVLQAFPGAEEVR
ncbi:MAG TPA: hypothetical protein VKW77_10100, partial [Acidimicrobiales bacterium]|nr:hypothetical protein [Acidimicrobiales bacterium]